VRVNELITGVNIALDHEQLSACAFLDVSGNLHVEVNEVVNAVNNALKGCPPAASPTPTGTGGPNPTATATPTATPTTASGSPTGPSGARLAGATTVVVNALGVIPSLIGAVANGIQFGGASGEGDAASFRDDGGIAAAACPGGGTATRTGNIFPGFNLDIHLNNCQVPTATGSVTFNGRIHQSGFVISADDGASGPTPGPLTAQFSDGLGMPTVMTAAKVTLTIAGVPAGGACQISSLTVTAAGTITSTTSAGASVSVTFNGTTVAVTMITF